jgi:site-specific DNA-methyltransferase (adenine-specific)
MKPAIEPICMAQKPPDGRMTDNVRQWGTGAVNVDGCRITGTPDYGRSAARADGSTNKGEFWTGTLRGVKELPDYAHQSGRWPANLILDEQAAAELDATVGESDSRPGKTTSTSRHIYSGAWGANYDKTCHHAFGGPSRFFKVVEPDLPIRYVAKAPASERALPNGKRNTHPTQKPIALMRYLVRLVTPPGGTVLDPFYGSGTTGCAARLEGFTTIGIEQDEEYCAIAVQRLAQQVLPLEAMS